MTLLHPGRQIIWMDPSAAASYAEVTPTEIDRAIHERELPAVTTLPEREGVLMVRSVDLDVWSLWALGRQTRTARDTERSGVALPLDRS
jgi:hypothetical protein